MNLLISKNQRPLCSVLLAEKELSISALFPDFCFPPYASASWYCPLISLHFTLYRQKAAWYNQTASKAEQIALCQFIRDGHLASQTRRLKRLYAQKLKNLLSAVREIFGSDAPVQIGAAGTSLALTLQTPHNAASLIEKSKLQTPHNAASLIEKSKSEGLRLQFLKESEGEVTVILSCSSMPAEDFIPACRLLKELSQI